MIDIDKHKTTLTIRSTLQSRLHHRYLMIPLFSQQALIRSITIAVRDKLEPAPVSDFPKRANRFFLILVHLTTLHDWKWILVRNKIWRPKAEWKWIESRLCCGLCESMLHMKSWNQSNVQLGSVHFHLFSKVKLLIKKN